MGKIQIFTGEGRGKTPAALGEALMAAALGKQVVIIQFLKGRGLQESLYQRRLEPEIKLFRFEKSDCDFFALSEEKRKEEIQHPKRSQLRQKGTDYRRVRPSGFG